MKVVHVHRLRGVGGSERHLLTLLPALRARGIDARFVGLDDGDPEPFYRVSVRCGYPTPQTFAEALAGWRRAIREVYRMIFDASG